MSTRISSKEIIHKPKVLLYDNIAKSGTATGRLRAELEIFPSPRIVWEFESLGKSASSPSTKNSVLINPIRGINFTIENGFVTKWSGGTSNDPYSILNGDSSKAILGKINLNANFFTFYLPNTKFLETITSGQGRVNNILIDDKWQISLNIQQSELEWLKPGHRNIGSLVTTTGILEPIQDIEKTKKRGDTMTIEKALSRLEPLNFLLSFANGGYTSPLYIEGWSIQKKIYNHVAFAIAPSITPLEQLSYYDWITPDSDLINYLNCFSALEKMRAFEHWRESLDTILTWYFQATQPQTSQFAKSWVVVANAAGAALERLSVLILVRDLNIRGLNSLTESVTTLLEKIGVTKARGFDDVDYVSTFVKLRNDATHPKKTLSMSETEIWDCLEISFIWIQEALLWRLGYNGKYGFNRHQKYIFTSPRYDLALRGKNW